MARIAIRDLPADREVSPKTLRQTLGGTGGGYGLVPVAQPMQKIPRSFNLQFLRLQSKMSHENRQFTLLSNIMKTKHDTARNAINNVR